MRKESISKHTEREYLENGVKGELLNQQSIVCVIMQGQLERMASYQKLNWEQ